MKHQALLTLSVFSIAAGQTDTTILKKQNSWTYTRSDSAYNITLTSGYSGKATFTIDSLFSSGDTLKLNVTENDSGTSNSVPTQTQEKSQFSNFNGQFSSSTPLFAYGSSFNGKISLAKYRNDTLKRDDSTTSPCVLIGYSYLQTIGMFAYSYSAACGITRENINYRLTAYDGVLFSPDSLTNLGPVDMVSHKNALRNNFPGIKNTGLLEYRGEDHDPKGRIVNPPQP